MTSVLPPAPGESMVSAAPVFRRVDDRAEHATRLEAYAASCLLVFGVILGVATATFASGNRLGFWVLPMSAGGAVLLLRPFCRSWLQTGRVASVSAAIHVAAGLIAVAFPDNSWDGLAYHQEAILRLAAGWNPLFEDAAAYGDGYELYINHYPNGPWTAGASVLLATDAIEAGKLFNITMMTAAAAQVTAALLRLTALDTRRALAIGALVALNPVFLYQSLTFYVDNLLGSALTILVAGLAGFAASRAWQSQATALMGACLAIDTKLTGLVYVAFLLAAAVPVLWWRLGPLHAWRFAIAALVVGIIGTGAIGFAPYVRNALDKGDPFYPAAPAHQLVTTSTQIPDNIRSHDRVTRFVISNFSQSETLRPPGETRLKFPLWVTAGERRGLYGADIEAGGFGPWFGALLLLSVCAAALLWKDRAHAPANGPVLVVAGILFFSIFVHQETWWARYVPQAWLLPPLLAVPHLLSQRRLRRWGIGGTMVVLMAGNLVIVGVNVGWRQVNYRVDTRLALRQMQKSSPVEVDLAGFYALRRRLHEAGVTYQHLSAAPPSDRTRHVIPAPGHRAFWITSRAEHP